MKWLLVSMGVLISTQSFASDRPSHCPRAWCGCWLAQHLGLNDRSLWLASEWRRRFQRTAEGIGAVIVWPHHVGIITGGQPGAWVILSGNDGHAVRERVRSTSGAVAVSYSGSAAIDRYDSSRHIAGGIAQHEGDGSRQFMGLAKPSHRGSRNRLASINPAWAQAVNADRTTPY